MDTNDYRPAPLTNLQDFSYFAGPLTAKTAAWHQQALGHWAHDNADTSESCEFVSKAFGYELGTRVSNIMIFPAALIDAICHIGVGAFTLLAVIPEKIYEWNLNRNKQAGEEGEQALNEYVRKFTFGGACANFEAAIKYLGVSIFGTAAGVFFDPEVAANMAAAGKGRQLHEVLQSPLAKGHRKFQEFGQEVKAFRNVFLKDEVQEGQELDVESPETLFDQAKDLFRMARARFEKKDEVSEESSKSTLDDVNEDLEKAQEEAERLNNQLEKASQIIGTHEATIARIENEKGNLEAILQKANETIGARESSISGLEQERMKARENLEKANETINANLATISKLEKELEAAKKRYTVHEEYMDALEVQQKVLANQQTTGTTLGGPQPVDDTVIAQMLAISQQVRTSANVSDEKK